MRKQSLQAAVLMFIFFTFILLLRTPLVRPVSPSPEYEVGLGEALPFSFHNHRREAANEATVLEIVPKKLQENSYVDHNDATNEWNEHKHTSSQNYTESHGAQNETRHEGHMKTETSSHSEPPVNAVGRGNVVFNKTIKTSQPAGGRGKPTATSPSLPGPGSQWAKLSKVIRLWNRNWTWGSHPLPGASEFKAGPGLRWVTFFHDQAVAPMLITDNSTVLACVVQEVIEEWEQKKALEYLGNIMPLEPVDLPLMVHLSSLCGLMNTPLPHAQQSLEPINVWTHGLSMLQGILPGTLWCGRSDKAEVYGQLGPRAALDSCCRTHDHCPTKLLPMDTRYGITNLSLKTMSHCSCELEFYRCLKAVKSDPLAITVGQVYFNILGLDCLKAAPASASSSTDSNLPETYNVPLKATSNGHTSPTPTTAAPRTGPKFVCYHFDSNGRCRKWVANPQAGSTVYKLMPSHLRF